MDFSLPRYSEIPNVGLFLEQVAKYINEYLEPLGEPGLTGSMISNYVKKGIIANPVKKQYGREQIAYLIFIAITKNVLSLDDINELIKLQKESSEPEEAYEYFRMRFTEILDIVFAQKDINTAASDSLVKKLAQNTMVTVAHKIYLDMNFAQLKSETDLNEKAD